MNNLSLIRLHADLQAATAEILHCALDIARADRKDSPSSPFRTEIQTHVLDNLDLAIDQYNSANTNFLKEFENNVANLSKP